MLLFEKATFQLRDLCSAVMASLLFFHPEPLKSSESIDIYILNTC